MRLHDNSRVKGRKETGGLSSRSLTDGRVDQGSQRRQRKDLEEVHEHDGSPKSDGPGVGQFLNQTILEIFQLEIGQEN